MTNFLKTNQALLDYQKTATVSFFIDLMTVLEEYKIDSIQLQYYPDTSPSTYNLVQDTYLMDEVLENYKNHEEIEFELDKVLINYKKHFPTIMAYVYESQSLKSGNCHEFDFDINDFSWSAIDFCGKDLLEEVEAARLNSKIQDNQKHKKIKV